MVSSLNMLNKNTVHELEVSKPLYLPNGTTTQVSHIGSCILSPKSIISNVLHIPKFKYNLL